MIKNRIDKRSGETKLQIDLRFHSRVDGTPERYRRDAQIQTKAGAKAEEQRVITYFTQHGTIAPLLQPPKPEPKPEAQTEQGLTWDAAVTLYLERPMRCTGKTKPLKATTINGYREVLDSPVFDALAQRPIASIDFPAWQTTHDGTLGASRFRHHCVVMRAVLRGAVRAGKLARLPELAPLPEGHDKKTRQVEPIDPKVVSRILAEDTSQLSEHFRIRREAFKVALALSAYAGLRAGEVRALRWGDLHLGDDPKEDLITVRLARTDGVEDLPKSGYGREIPFGPRLSKILRAEVARRYGGKDPQPADYVAGRFDGRPWSDNALGAALKRACKRLKLTDSSRRFHGLRHHFVTGLFTMPNADAVTIQKLAGHVHLRTTQIYAHTSQKRKREAMKMF